MFLDVVESVNILVNSNGQIIRSDVVGALKMRTYLRFAIVSLSVLLSLIQGAEDAFSLLIKFSNFLGVCSPSNSLKMETMC